MHLSEINSTVEVTKLSLTESIQLCHGFYTLFERHHILLRSACLPDMGDSIVGASILSRTNISNPRG